VDQVAEAQVVLKVSQVVTLLEVDQVIQVQVAVAQSVTVVKTVVVRAEALVGQVSLL